MNYIKNDSSDFKKDFQYYGNQIETIVYGIIGERIIVNDIGTGKTLTQCNCKMLMKYGDVVPYYVTCITCRKLALIMISFGDGEMFKIT